jgi:tetratricopeptide (TPR) repeat protein
MMGTKSRNTDPESAIAFRWEFLPRFRRGAFGWRGSALACQRVRQAVAEIRKVARKNPVLAGEGAVRFLERISGALEQIDSSSGAIGNAVYGAILDLVPIVSSAPVEEKVRSAWMDRLWKAHEDDRIPYIESLTDHWGELCASRGIASKWADELLPFVKMVFGQGSSPGAHFHGTTAVLSALLFSGRYEELLELLELDPLRWWYYRAFGAKALVAMGRKAEAVRYAEACRGLNAPDAAISRFCEEVLLSSGMVDEAYERYGLATGQRQTYLATFRAVAKRYPNKDPREILDDLIASTPGAEGKWFAAAREAGFLDTALRLAESSPCDPKTLTRAARGHGKSDPDFAVGVGLAALRWISAGYGYELTGFDVVAAARFTLEAARNSGRAGEVQDRIRAMITEEGRRPGEGTLYRFLGKDQASRNGPVA